MKVSYLTLIKRYIPILFIGIALSFASCEKTAPAPTDEPEEPGEPLEEESENQEINEWITEQMRTYYYWNTEIPPDRLLDFELDPPKFFDGILSDKDRFSWIQKADELNEGMQGVSTSTGIDVALVGYNVQNGTPQNLFCVINYVIPGSPADLAGLERGDMFTKLNNQELTPDNFRNILDPYFTGKSFSITLATLDGNILTTTDETVSLSAAKVDEPSVHFNSIITSASGKKVGYIFYNRFLNNKTEELFDVFTEFKAAGVNELILDLRYNLGGGIAASGVLSALMMDDYTKENIFVNYNYNDLLNQSIDATDERNGLTRSTRDTRFKDLYLTFVEDPPGADATEAEIDAAAAPMDAKVGAANLNLSKVYILATDNSASASELVIHNLAPYIDVIHIGGTTVGKNEGSITIEDERNPRQIDWALQPIIVKLADKNGNGDYEDGLVPDKQVNEYDYLPLSPLGSKEDPLVLTALQIIDPAEGQTVQAKQMSIARSHTQKASFRVIEEFKEKNIKPLPVLLDNIQIKPAVIEHVKQQISKP